MKLLFKPNTKKPQTFKCYRCGYTSNKTNTHCPNCLKDGFLIKMIIQMEG